MAAPEVAVLADAEAVTEEAARRFTACAEDAIGKRGRFAVALAGGATPAALYRRLTQPDLARRVDWERALIAFGDERCTPPDHAYSNYRMARETLLDHAPIPSDHVLRMPGEAPGEAAAVRYAEMLRCAFDLTPDELPRFDLILLGIGADGHTASLFPGMPVLKESKRVVAYTEVPPYVTPAISRLTLTFPVLNAAASVIFLATGTAKAEAVQRALARAEGVPAAHVQPTAGHLAWLLDSGAAREVTAHG
jgi:6-phosphogluconolactonase